MSDSRVLLVVPSASSVRVFLREVAEAWVADGGEMAIATAADLPGVSGRWPNCAPRFDLPELRGGVVSGLPRAVLRLRRLVREWRPDIVHAHFGVAALMCALARSHEESLVWMATFHGLHGTLARHPDFNLTARAEIWAAAQMDRSWVLNQEDLNYLRQAGIERGKVGLQRAVGCDLRQFAPQRFSATDRARLRAELNLPADAPVLVFVGRSVEFKGFAITVRAFWRARETVPALRLLIVGATDPIHATGLSPAEETQLASDPTIVRTGWREDVAPCLAIADLCVFPSRREGMPVNLMEALAMGVPVITGDARGCRDVVRDGVEGCVLSRPDDQSLAREILELIEHPARRAEMARNALAGRTRFARQWFVDEQTKIYRRCLTRENDFARLT